MEYEQIFELLRREKSTDELQPLPVDDVKLSEIQNKAMNTTKILSDLFELRKKKYVSSTLNLHITSKFFEYCQIATHYFIKSLEYCELNNFSVMYDGDNGFFVRIPFVPSKEGYVEYLNFLIKEPIKEEIKKREGTNLLKIAEGMGIDVKSIKTKTALGGIDLNVSAFYSVEVVKETPLEFSLNNRTSLARIYVDTDKILDFKKEKAVILPTNYAILEGRTFPKKDTTKKKEAPVKSLKSEELESPKKMNKFYRERRKREHKKWTAQDEGDLMVKWKRGRLLHNIAKDLERTPLAIKMRVEKLGLPFPRRKEDLELN